MYIYSNYFGLTGTIPDLVPDLTIVSSFVHFVPAFENVSWIVSLLDIL